MQKTENLIPLILLTEAWDYYPKDTCERLTALLRLICGEKNTVQRIYNLVHSHAANEELLTLMDEIQSNL